MQREFGPHVRVWGWKLRILILALVASLVTGIYAFWIEPYWIEVTHHRVPAPISRPIKIAHLTDIHTYGLGLRERKMLEILKAEKPDLIAITGDSISIASNYPGLRDVLTQMHAPLGVWVVRGNHEDWYPVKNEPEFYQSAGTKLLLNSSHEVCEGVWLIGFDDSFGGNPDAEKAFAGSARIVLQDRFVSLAPVSRIGSGTL